MNVVKKIIFDEGANAQEMVNSGLVDEIKTTSRSEWKREISSEKKSGILCFSIPTYGDTVIEHY